ncbi:MAG: phosphoribosylanthranilate isomerase [Planctomycetes bacterium]|nr:phosphoribosylanthranilate isomerase [Planctomycetota bacterium]
MKKIKRVRVKICGIKSVKDALAAVDAGCDAIGFNFFPDSVRFISIDKAIEITKALPPLISLVAVFANADPTQVEEIIKKIPRIDYYQFHGSVPKLDIIKNKIWIATLSIDESMSLNLIQNKLDSISNEKIPPAAILVDTKIKGLFGGTGIPGPWELIARLKFNHPLILAGGLTPFNLTRAISITNPYGVDVASGVENASGEKCPIKMLDFVTNSICTFSL